MLLLRFVMEIAMQITFIRGNIRITTSENFLIPSSSLVINCTSTVPVNNGVISFNVDYSPIFRTRYFEDTGNCMFQLVGNSSVYDCDERCGCALNGRSAAWNYNYNSNRSSMNFSCASQNAADLSFISDTIALQRVLPPQKPITNEDFEITINSNHNLHINCTSPGGRPPAEFNWFIGKKNVTNDSVIVSSIQNHVADTHTVTSELRHKVDRESHGQNVYCMAINPVVPEGISSVPIVLYVRGEPDYPGLFSIVSVTRTTITVQWAAGYDGGYHQTFVLYHRQSDRVDYITETIKLNVNESVQQFNISGLYPATLYQIKLYAENKINRSKSTHNIKVSTLGSLDIGSEDTNKQETVLIGSLSAFILILLVVSGLLAIKHYLLLKKYKEQYVAETVKYHSPKPIKQIDEYENTARNEDIQISSKTDAAYDDLGAKDKPNIYEELQN